MSIRPQPSKHNLREGIIKSWEYLLSKAPPEWQFGIPILKKFGQSFWYLMWQFRTAYYVKYGNCSFQKLCSKIPEPYSFHHSWGSWFCSRDPRLVQHRGSRSGGTLIWTSSTAWGEPTEVTPLVQVKVEGPSKSFLDDRAIGTTEFMIMGRLNRWRRELPDISWHFFFYISFFRTFDSMIFLFCWVCIRSLEGIFWVWPNSSWPVA